MGLLLLSLLWPLLHAGRGLLVLFLVQLLHRT